MHRNSKAIFHKCKFNILTIMFFTQVKTRCKINKNFLNTQIIMKEIHYQILYKGIPTNKFYLAEFVNYEDYRNCLNELDKIYIIISTNQYYI